MKARKTYMSKKEKFLNFIETNLFAKTNLETVETDVLDYWNALKGAEDVNKPLFTDNGKLVMEYLQSLADGAPAMKSKDIAEALFVSSRTVSGAMRKLVSDGFVEKMGESPVLYLITEKGKNIEIK